MPEITTSGGILHRAGIEKQERLEYRVIYHVKKRAGQPQGRPQSQAQDDVTNLADAVIGE